MSEKQAIQFLGDWLEKFAPCSDCSPNEQRCRCLARADADRISRGEHPLGTYLAPEWLAFGGTGAASRTTPAKSGERTVPATNSSPSPASSEPQEEQR